VDSLQNVYVSGTTASWQFPVTPGSYREVFDGHDMFVAKLNAELKKALDQPDTKERFAAQGFSATWTTPEKFGAYIESEHAKWAKVVKDSGAKID